MVDLSSGRTRSRRFAQAQAGWDGVGRYLAAATMGLPSADTVAALRGDLDEWACAGRHPRDYVAMVERTRAHYAAIVNVDVDRVAIGSQTSSIVGMVAASLPSGCEVLCVDGDFSSMVFPFLQRRDITVRHVPLEDLANSITTRTGLVAFSHIQSATGQVADVAAITRSALRSGAWTFCDTTQSVGVYPVDAALFDATVCHAYKWLCAPRGVAFLTVSSEFQAQLNPVHAGWYAGEDIWGSCYGPSMELAASARRFDTSPAWQAWAGAGSSLETFAGLDMHEVWDWAVGLGDLLCAELDIAVQGQAIVTWPDPDGADLARLTGAGITAAGRAGRLRVAFHLWNGPADVDAVLRALGRT